MPTDSASKPPSDASRGGRRFLALGDSYTIGEGVAREQTWPFQMVRRLRDAGQSWSDPLLFAQTGWTTAELIAAIDQADWTDAEKRPPFDLVTLLIGVNNQYRGLPVEGFLEESRRLIQLALSWSRQAAGGVRVVSIPDWSVTRFGRASGRARVAEQIDRFNQAQRRLAEECGCRWIDVTDLSRQAGDRPEMLAEDGLHPSSAAYRQWADRVAASLTDAA